MRKKFLKFSLLAAIGLASAAITSCKDDETKPGQGTGPGTGANVPLSVEINGVTWATRNVDKPGTFAENPESSGMLYQWNSKIAWTDTVTFVKDWDNTVPGGYEWEAKNDPCPEGWRLPTVGEMKSLLEIKKVAGGWDNLNEVGGYKFTDIKTNASVFFPAVGYRDGGDGRLRGAGSSGMYWSAESTSSNVEEIEEAYYIESGGNGAILGDYHKRNRAFSLRCVAK